MTSCAQSRTRNSASSCRRRCRSSSSGPARRSARKSGVRRGNASADVADWLLQSPRARNAAAAHKGNDSRGIRSSNNNSRNSNNSNNSRRRASGPRVAADVAVVAAVVAAAKSRRSLSSSNNSSRDRPLRPVRRSVPHRVRTAATTSRARRVAARENGSASGVAAAVAVAADRLRRQQANEPSWVDRRLACPPSRQARAPVAPLNLTAP